MFTELTMNEKFWSAVVGFFVGCSIIYSTEGQKTNEDGRSVLEGIIDINKGNNILMSELQV